MIERIEENEKRLDNILKCIKELEDALENYKENKKNIELLNEYYGSKEWFKDKEKYEKGKIKKIKAGVLSEDAVWNMNENLKELEDNIHLIFDSNT